MRQSRDAENGFDSQGCFVPEGKMNGGWGQCYSHMTTILCKECIIHPTISADSSWSKKLASDNSG